MIAAPAPTRTAPAGKYLFFRLGREEFGIEILRVHEIANSAGLRTRPGLPDWAAGVVEVRGRTLPVIDLHGCLPGATTPAAAETHVVVVDVRDEGAAGQVGLLVDGVTEVRRLADDHIEGVEAAADEQHYLAGWGRVDGAVAGLLDTDSLVAGGDLARLWGAPDHGRLPA